MDTKFLYPWLNWQRVIWRVFFLPIYCIIILLLISCSVVSSSLWPYGLQHARLPCPSPTPEACSNSCPLSQWCHPSISSSVIPFSSCPQSFPASGSFSMWWLFATGGQNIGASASASAPPMNIQSWFPLGLTDLISLLSKELSRVSSSTIVWKHRFFGTQLLQYVSPKNEGIILNNHNPIII